MLVRDTGAQSFTVLHNFSDTYNATNSDGVYPFGRPIVSGGILYGTTDSAGPLGGGTVFAMSTNGSVFSNLLAFPSTANCYSGLTTASGVLYGTTLSGGPFSGGTVFRVNINGTGFTNLHSFLSGDPTDGFGPWGALLLSGNTLYGSTDGGGASNLGTLFRVNIDGSGYTTLHSFKGDSDGCYPAGALLISGNTLCGTAAGGGSLGAGTVFSLNTDGTGFRTLCAVNPTNCCVGATDLLASDNTLYCMTDTAIFALNTDGTGFRVLHHFTAGMGWHFNQGLVLWNGRLYGVIQGPPDGFGLFSVNTDGTGFTILYNFSGTDGNSPYSGLALSDGILYGVAASGGSSNSGTVFSFVIPPQLAMIPSAVNVVLTWSTNFTGFHLQSTTNLASPAWTTDLPAPVVVSGQFTVTNPISGTQQFFRLSKR